MTSAGAYLALTKPRLLPLVVLSSVPVLLATRVRPGVAAAALAGTALAAGAANALNSYLERERDALMERTRTRPLPSGALAPARALAFGLGLGVLGTALLWFAASPAAALIALGAILFYVFVYTLWLKPRTPLAVVLGGISGAISPLVVDAAIDGSIGAVGALLFAIVFLWQPPHFYAISLRRLPEYERAGFPMLASRRGAPVAARRGALWVAALVATTVVAPAWTPLGFLYGAAAIGLGGWFGFRALALVRSPGAAEADRLFHASLLYLMALFMAMIADLLVRGGAA